MSQTDNPEPAPAAAAQLNLALAYVGWNNRTFAGILGCDESTVRAWLTGVTPVPAKLLRWLGAVQSFLDKHPPPDWRVRDEKRWRVRSERRRKAP